MLNPDATLAELRAPLVDAMLPHANFDGWGTNTLLAAAADLGLNADTAALVFTGPADMIAAWTVLADARMAERLAVEGGADMKIRARVTCAIRIRLEDAAPHREAVARALAVQARPGNLRSAAATAWATADAIWRACGDTSTDFNYYSKRAIVGSVYGATLLYWLRDDSEGHAETWAFLDRRIAGVMQIEKLKAQARGFTANLPDPVRFLGRLRYPES